MTELTMTTFLTLDGVMQAPGGPNEDTSGAGVVISTYQRAGRPAYGSFEVDKQPRFRDGWRCPPLIKELIPLVSYQASVKE